MTLPSGCRHEEGPGTLDAVCSPEFDAEKSHAASAAAALVLEVGVGARTRRYRQGALPTWRKRYGEARFKAELPEAVCGESDQARVKIEGVQAGSRRGASCVHGRGRAARRSSSWGSASAAPPCSS